MKSRRDITLGEMQDECSFRGDNCETIGGDKCKFFELCATMQTIDKGCLTPIMWNLTDPPRFNEAQMALLRALYGLDFVSIKNLGSGAFKTTSKDGKTGMFMEQLGIGENETLDLAELLEKEGEET